MKIIVCPDSFKGSLFASEAAHAIADGFRQVFANAAIIQLPLADGGEGTVDALVTATHGRLERRTVQNPLGEPVEAVFGILGDGCTGVIEMAAASGLPLVPENKRDPRITSTFGTGELISAALDEGCDRLIIGIGGSATNDGGSGAVTALGARLLDKNGEILPPGGAALIHLHSLDLRGLDPRLWQTQITVACDVTNPLCGPEGASAVYGPQKGASPEMVEQLDAALHHYGKVLEQKLNKQVIGVPGSGAAGGLGAALYGILNAELRSGIDIVMESVRFNDHLQDADLVVTGEGKLDEQTAHGKVVKGVTEAAHRFGVPVVAIAGSIMEKGEELVDAAASITPRPMSLNEAVENAADLLRDCSRRTARLIAVGKKLGHHTVESG